VNVLAIDTSTPIGTVAIAAAAPGSGEEAGGDLRILAEVTADVRARHGESLLVLIEEAMRHARLAPSDIGLLACGLGPGSFTGLRVGLATAKGLAVARNVPIVGIASLRVLARARTTSLRTIVPVIDAHKGEVYAAVYRSQPDGTLTEQLAPFHGEPEEAARHLRTTLGAGEEPWLCGDGLRAHGARFLEGLGAPFTRAGAVHDIPRASHLAAEAWEAYRSRGPDDLSALEPMYVRPSDAKLPIAVPG
jgi:tRNA threonylcarbamoyladenosine biosynthesis protein TsaB